MSSLTLNMVGGGGGGLAATDALLRVQAPAGSTVTITKGAVTKSDAGHENADDHTVYDYYFIIHQSQFDSVNPWTVTGTKNGESMTDTVTINAADEYDVSLLWLTIVKEGYTVNGYTLETQMRSGYTVEVTEGYDSSEFLSVKSPSNYTSGIGTVKIDVTNYKTLRFEGRCGVYLAQYSGRGNFGLWSSANNSGAGFIDQGLASADIRGTTVQTLDLDISNINGEVYVAVNVQAASSGSSSLRYDVWVENLKLMA